MKTNSFLIMILLICLGGILNNLQAQGEDGTFFKPIPATYEVNHAVELESLFPMYFYGGYHLGVGYRYKKFRLRVSVINGGDYNADNQAVGDKRQGFKRYYTTSPGIFFGYNVWKNLEIYGYYERHTFEVEQLQSNEKHDIPSNDKGLGISYQFFIGRYLYIQPGIHSYFRNDYSITFSNSETYNIPTFELTPIVRVGVRFYQLFE